MSKNLSELTGREGISNNLFEKYSNNLSNQELSNLANEFLIGKSNVYGSITFYDFLKPENKNKKVYVCNGSACECAGSQNILTKVLKKHFAEDEIGHACCLGRCHENGAFSYNGKNYSAKTEIEINDIIKKQNINSNDNYSVKSISKQILTGESITIENFKTALKKTFKLGENDALKELKKSQLRGRGGAGFPIGIKLESCKNTESDTKFIICNADEGDPGAYSDRYLLEQQALKVLFGIMVSGYITGANWGILYIRAEYPDAVNIIQKTIKQLKDNQLIGDNILNSNFNFDFKIIKAQGAYICGEETALINSIEGQRPEVRTRPPYPAQQGLFNKPTIVNNVETQASIYYIINNGGDAYNKIGTSKSSGTKLVCLDGQFNIPGIYEVEMGYSLKDLIYKHANGFKNKIKAMQIGGPLGGVVPINMIEKLNIDFESFANNGFLLGHASIVGIRSDYPMIKYIEHLFDFAAYESCGKCFPCRLGTKRGHELFSKAINENYKIDISLLNDLLETLEQGSLCAHGGGIPLPIKNILTYFKEEINPFLSNK